MKIGLDVGSTTLKCMVYDGQDQPIYQEYERHFSQIAEKASGMLTRIQENACDQAGNEPGKKESTGSYGPGGTGEN